MQDEEGGDDGAPREKAEKQNCEDSTPGIVWRGRAKQQLFRGVIGKHCNEERKKACPSRSGQPGFAEGQIKPGSDQEMQKQRRE